MKQIKTFYKSLLTLVFGWCISFFVSAQQDEQWTHYSFNQQYYNPGFTGIEKQTRFTLLHRSQWLGYTATIVDDQRGGAPSQQQFSYTQPLSLFGSRSVNSGIAVTVNNDRLGPYQKMDGKLDLAYHFSPNFGGTFGFGGRVAWESMSIDGSLLREIQPGDPVVNAFGNSRSRQGKPTFGAGIYYNHSKFFVSVAVHDVTEASFDYNTSGGDVNFTLDRSVWIGGGYNINVSRLTVIPSIHYKSDFNFGSVNVGGLVELDSYKYWAGINARQSFANKTGGERNVSVDDLNFLVGIGLLKDNSLRVGYGFDLVTNFRSAKSGTSHEIMLSYAFPVVSDRKRPTISDPRYNHNK